MTLTLDQPASITEAAVRLRAAKSTDLSVIHDILTACGLFTASVTLDGSTYWIADLNGTPVGVIGLEHGRGASLLRSAAVLPHARGMGVGRALAQSALTLATLRGDRAVYLFSSDAGAYWRGFGFTEVPVMELANALPDTPQVQSGLRRGWITEEVAWCKTLDVLLGEAHA